MSDDCDAVSSALLGLSADNALVRKSAREIDRQQFRPFAGPLQRWAGHPIKPVIIWRPVRLLQLLRRFVERVAVESTISTESRRVEHPGTMWFKLGVWSWLSRAA